MYTFRRKLTYTLSAALYAVGQFYLTAFIFFDVTGGNVLAATFWNLGIILVFILVEKVEYYFLSKMCLTDGDKKVSIPRRILRSYLTGASIKSALYFFYMGILICTAILAADPDFSPFLHEMRYYFLSVRYGILFLIAADKFFDQLFKDMVKDADTLSGGRP